MYLVIENAPEKKYKKILCYLILKTKTSQAQNGITWN